MEIIPNEEEEAIDAIPLAVKSLRIVDWKIYKEGKKSYYQIIRADGKSKMYMFFSQMLTSFDREDLEDLCKLIKAKYRSTRPVEDLDLLLWGDLKKMFKPHIEDVHVADDAVHKELGDSLVRAATTASSLGTEQDSGNIAKTQSMETPNESSSQGTHSGGGPRCQETIRDTTAQTRFESVSKHSNDSLLRRGSTLQSDEDRLKLNELMALCITLQNMVLELEKTKTSQHNEIASLKRRVKKLKKGIESLGEDASKQGSIEAMDADEDITIVNDQDDADKDMFYVNVLGGEEVFAAGGKK
uniref:Uncharacterized protein n=1 Tax=Tanacetum cinerariifolium TaxID=118510 RepID=A0A699HJ55_TANCI|nr:hypothetical protein [Tanacetum cinerariifolium]